jgi:CrcB protein
VRGFATGAFPVATLVVNLLGSFVMGAVAGGATPGTATYLFVTVGVLGGFTTYSAFNQESLGLFEGGATGTAFLYVAATLVGCLVAGLAGLRLGRALFA